LPEGKFFFAKGNKTMKHLRVTLIALTVSVIMISCQTNNTIGHPVAGYVAVTSISPLTSIAESIAGDKIQIKGLIPEGENSHEFEPPPSIIRDLSKADLIILNGFQLETHLIELAETNKKDSAELVLLADLHISEENFKYDFSFPEENGHPNPHTWTDPILGLTFAEEIMNRFVKLDPDNQIAYETNYQNFRNRILKLDILIKESIASIEPINRKLLTYHDSFPYFAERYGMEIIGAMQPSDFSEPTPREVIDLIKQINKHNVPAIFGSEVFPSPILKQLSRESGVEYIDELRDDDLPGEPGDSDHSYIGLLIYDLEVIVRGLGGDYSEIKHFDISPTFQGATNTVYPQ